MENVEREIKQFLAMEGQIGYHPGKWGTYVEYDIVGGTLPDKYLQNPRVPIVIQDAESPEEKRKILKDAIEWRRGNEFRGLPGKMNIPHQINDIFIGGIALSYGDIDETTYVANDPVVTKLVCHTDDSNDEIVVELPVPNIEPRYVGAFRKPEKIC